MTVLDEPILDVGHLAHAELLTPAPAESLAFFVDLLGMEQEASDGGSVYLRGFGDYERYCLKLTEAPAPGLGHIALRARSAAALERRASALERSGRGIGWIEGDVGHGAAYRFTDPDGRLFEVYHETERYQPPEHLVPAMLNQYQKRTGRGDRCAPARARQRHLAERSSLPGVPRARARLPRPGDHRAR